MRTTLSLAAAFAIAAAPIFAAGSDDDKPPKKTKTTIECDEGMVYDENKEECVNAEDVKESHLGNDTLYEMARELAYDGQYQTSLIILSAMSDQADPRVLNYRGFNTRQMGDVETAFTFYEQAIAADPTYSLARSYYGQGLVTKGDYKEALKQLTMIKKNGDRDTWAYASLDASIRTGNTYTY
ncbi:MAG: tetratricopeptide repeat protein [Pseudomonadota bacterium]